MIDDRSSAALQRLQGEILEAIARGEPLQRIADLLCRRVEGLVPDVVCSILVVDAQGRVHSLAAPSLPEPYSHSLDGMSIGPVAGSCGTAAWRGEPVEVTDIETDPLWVDYRHLALPLGLRACWSSPIKARDGRVIGTFAFYYRTCRGPAAIERAIVERCVDLCAIAIEHDAVQAHVQRLAFHDPVTGLANRSAFIERATAALVALAPGEAVNVLYIDLDDFKAVNDTLGHRLGDQLLGGVAQRLAACIHADAFVARLGGDEFAVLQPCRDAEAEGHQLAARIRAALDEPFDVDDQRVMIGASVGIAHASAPGLDLDELARRADMALYEAKAAGRRTHRFFDAAMDTHVQMRRSLKQDLRAAIEAGAFNLVYQPIVALETGEPVAVEALLRWSHPARGNVPPASFIPVVEEMGLIGPLGDWVLRTACAAAARWPRGIKVGVNLSPLQLRRSGFVLDVVGALQQSGLPAERLDLEVTESALLASDIATRTAINELHDLGVRLSLDDFGTGYSSLQLLRAFPFDKIKIDMSFVRDIGIDADSEAIIRAVIRLARDLGIRTAAEGVETAAQYDWLAHHRCSEVQGFHCSRPLVEADLRALLERGASSEVAAGADLRSSS
ncbi:putative bifunctional diguanylate cyclase/phosphodiesterase [Dokdonella fugitiva]|uniref:Diguanylate cyclase (GGDEF)-like protein n=1 Tax=Dokdonella fugitiva TaxID=328517 RepID=A0A4R2IEW1_9GAMM|nr:EAL domain-containing protein [Dokdonella fugitiva]TCO43231.1 diguanylate cyclase (GGDEF)-like protein [Dokdonella fugitiva]